MANMESICKQYGPSVNAFLIVPVVGGVILDFINSILIAFFINIIG
jgi:ESS family glutamate:Na+ symporter